MGFTTAAALVHELMEARDERRLLNVQRQLSRLSLLIIGELGFVPPSPTGAELLFEVFSQRYERGSILVTTNLPFDEWTEVFGSERLTGAPLDRLTHHVHILEMNGDSYRLKHNRENATSRLQKNRTTFGPLSVLYKLSPTFPLSDPTQPRFTLKVGHHSAAPVVRFLPAIDTDIFLFIMLR